MYLFGCLQLQIKVFVFCLQDFTPMLTLVVVPRLPRGAVVEWHVLATSSDPVDQSHFSSSIQRSGYHAMFEGSISSCKTCASLVLSVSASSPQKPVLDWHHVSALIEDCLQKAFSELSSQHLIPLCCRTFYRSNNLELQSLQEGESQLFATYRFISRLEG